MTEKLTPRGLSDPYVDALIALDPVTATTRGLPDGADRPADVRMVFDMMPTVTHEDGEVVARRAAALSWGSLGLDDLVAELSAR